MATDSDTMWDVAETVFGDGSRVGELLELNPHIGSARQLRPGQVIVVPAGVSIPDSRRPASPTQLAPDAHDEPESTADGAHHHDRARRHAVGLARSDHLDAVGADTDPTPSPSTWSRSSPPTRT